MSSIIKVDTVQDQDGNNIINENANTVTVGKSGDTVNIVGTATNFTSTGIDDNATSTAITINSSERVGINETNPEQDLHLTHNSTLYMRAENTTLGCVTDFGTSSVGSTIINRSAHPMKFFTDSTERMSISGSGSVGIGTGVPSQALDVVGSIEVSDGIYIGGTAAANKLDDYEEGSWTPGYEGTTGSAGSLAYTTQTGRYTKIGNTVFATGEIKLSNKGSFGGAIRISGLPFAPLAGLAINLGSIVLGNVDFATGVVGFNGVLASGSNFYIWKTTDNAVEAVMLTSDATNTSNFYFNFTYTTTS